MAKKQQSAADNSVDLVASFPWWVGIALAVIFYFVLHHFAVQKPVLGLPSSLRDTIINSAATVGQFLLPLFCVLGALKSFVSRARRRKLIDKIPASNPAAAVNSLKWQDFELLVGQAFRMQGYAVTETGQAGADGGIDLVLTKGRERTLVQCKHWRAQTVGVAIVRELYGAMAADGAVAGIVVTSGRFSADAKAFASGRNVDLMDGQALATLIGTAKAAPLPRPLAAPIAPLTAPPRATLPPPTDAPNCPTCAKNNGCPHGNAWRQYRTGVLGLRLLPGLSRHTHAVAATDRARERASPVR
jgi:restriction system protein